MQTDDAIHLYRNDPARNMARFYRMSSTPSLFGDICLVREWRRIGRPGRIRIDPYETGEEAVAASDTRSRGSGSAAIVTRPEWNDVRG